MEKILKKDYIYIALISVITIVMIFFITQKEGYHEDEMFSYGSSSYVYDNVYRSYGKMDATNSLVFNKILRGNVVDVIKNIKYYCLDHKDERIAYCKDFNKNKRPIWRTSEEAKDYMTVTGKEILNYPLVYYNQARDVHPPLFYFAVNTVSTFFLGNFSKAIIGIINVSFMIATLFVIKKILESLDKKHLIIPVLIFYGFSIGAISTVVFQRMYAMLTFFILEYILININISKNNFDIDKKTWIKLGAITILGFLTQYYFCIVAVIVAIYMFIRIYLKKDKKKTMKYILNYVKIAIIGVLIYPPAINHIFFSYRGIGKANMQKSFIEKIVEYFSKVGYSYSVPMVVLLTIVVVFLAIYIIKKVKNKEKIINNENIMPFVLAVIFDLYMAVVIQVSPEYNTLRYIMAVLPILAIVMFILIDACFENKKISTSILIVLASVVSIYGLIVSEPDCLFKGYNRYLKIAEENKHTKFVYIGSTLFNHIQSMPEFAIYDESLIIDSREIKYVIEDEELKKTEEFILSIKKYKGDKEILKEIIDNTEFKNYELLLDDEGEPGCIIYKMKR
ncbi:MAG: hypothetical protein HFJ44_01520 [Clostridia bacterium]|jgi:hypothetical protein|nr:hypothetical protein [Clostridia bacterium]